MRIHSTFSTIHAWVAGLCLLLVGIASAEQPPARPNIVFILCDDLGYGDVHCLAPATSRIQTPCADKLAAEGMIFTDAHSGSSVCTPTRYGLMTGRYSWRTRLQRGVVQGFAPDWLLQTGRRSPVSSKIQGYHTGVIGKWHLRFSISRPGFRHSTEEKQEEVLGSCWVPRFPMALSIAGLTIFMVFIMQGI